MRVQPRERASWSFQKPRIHTTTLRVRRESVQKSIRMQRFADRETIGESRPILKRGDFTELKERQYAYLGCQIE
jgi:hypothetical protein